MILYDYHDYRDYRDYHDENHYHHDEGGVGNGRKAGFRAELSSGDGSKV